MPSTARQWKQKARPRASLKDLRRRVASVVNGGDQGACEDLEVSIREALVSGVGHMEISVAQAALRQRRSQLGFEQVGKERVASSSALLEREKEKYREKERRD